MSCQWIPTDDASLLMGYAKLKIVQYTLVCEYCLIDHFTNQISCVTSDSSHQGAALRPVHPLLNQDQVLYLPQINRLPARPQLNLQQLRFYSNMSLSSSSGVGGPPWRNHSFILGGRDPPLSDQGETIIGVYLLLLGGHK